MHAGRKVKRVMRDDDADARFGHAPQAIDDAGDLMRVDAPLSPRQRARGIDAKRDHLLVFMLGLELGIDIPAVSDQRRNEPCRDVPERHVMIAGNKKFWWLQGV